MAEKARAAGDTILTDATGNPRQPGALKEFISGGGSASIILVLVILAAGAWLIADAGPRFRAPPVTSPIQHTLWYGYNQPNLPRVVPQGPAELGVVFQPAVSGSITGIRFYVVPGDPGPQSGSIWTREGTLLASALFAPNPTEGWVEVVLDPPLPSAAGQPLVVSVHSLAGDQLATSDDFANVAEPALNVDSLVQPRLLPGSTMPRSVYHLDGPGFPKKVARDRVFWVDVIFVPEGAAR